MKDLRLYSFFFCFVLVFYSLPSCCIAENFMDFFFQRNKSFTYNLPKINKKISNRDEYINLTLFVTVAFEHGAKVAYFPVVLESFNMTHINTKTKLPKFTKRIKEAFPKGMYGLDVANIAKLDVVMNGVYMKPEDNIAALMEKSHINVIEPIPIVVVIHPTEDWLRSFFLKELNADFENAKIEYDRKRKVLVDDINNFFNSLNLSHIKLQKLDDLCTKNLDFICSKGEEKFDNKHIQVLIQLECKEWKERLSAAKNELDTKKQHLDTIMKNNLRKN